jgi:hypothetical protein
MRRTLLATIALVALPVLASPVADDRATKDDYSLDTTGSASTLKVGGEGPFLLKITPKNGKKVHPDAPLEISFADNAVVKPAKQKLGRADLKEKGAKEPVAATTLRATKAGATSLEVTVSFFLCTDAWCQRMSDRVLVPVTVEE